MARRKKRSKKQAVSILKRLNLSPITYLVIVLFLVYINFIYKEDIINYVNGVNTNTTQNTKNNNSYNIGDIPEYSGSSYVIINNNVPYFDKSDLTTNSFEKYSKRDSLNRCGVAFANVGIETMPTEKRGSIGMVKPSGWHTVKYDIVDGKYLYNRCHLIGFQLAGENANNKNLITGTRYLNVEGMLPFENAIAEYVKTKNKHVLYRVTPIFKDRNLVASGVQMEAESVEDRGKSICFNVYVYNNQPGVEIDYKNGKSKLIK